MSDDGYDPRVTAHCLSVYGCPVAEQNGQMSAGGATAGVQATAGGPEAMQGVDSDAGQVDGQLWAMSEEKVCVRV